ncbi:MAG: hypothetical protein JW703_02370 [Candidatus Diapherotrites archaeon]|nr:hypothetical protein [Candidatus Diapherotrites archaeon]
MIPMDCKAQVSFEYLITVAISMILVIVAMILAIQIGSLSDAAKLKIIESRNALIESMIQ